MPRRRILLTSTHSAAFVLHDSTLLQKHFEVEHLVTGGIGSLFKVMSGVARCDVTFTWFASVYSFFVVFAARLMRKPSIIVVAGADLVALPEIGYGLRLSPWKRWLVRHALRNATRVLAVDPSLLEQARRFTGTADERMLWLPTGYDATIWTPAGNKERIVLTVAGCENEIRMKVKGIDFLFDVAREMSETQFLLVGIREPLLSMLQNDRPTNLQMLPFVEQSLLLSHYRRAKVYCQPSRSEGLPNSVCEAMLCQCVPVGTDVGGTATALGGNGFSVRFGDRPAMIDALRRALDAPDEQGQQARKYIEREFPLSKREAGLVQVIDEVLG